jgi:hypothetical protein
MFFFDNTAKIPDSSGELTTGNLMTTFWNSKLSHEPYILKISGPSASAEYIVTNIVNSSNSYFRLQVTHVVSSGSLVDNEDYSISLEPSRVDKQVALAYDSDGIDNAIGTDASGNPIAQTIDTIVLPTAQVSGTDVDELVVGYNITYNAVYKPWSLPDGNKATLDMWMSKASTSGYIQSSYSAFWVTRENQESGSWTDQEFGVSRSFKVIDLNNGIEPGVTLQLNVAVKEFDSSGTSVTDTNTGTFYNTYIEVTPILRSEYFTTTGVSGFGLTTSTTLPSTTGVTRTSV